jgi:phosphoribosylformylglycinamidine synthase
MGQVDDVCRVLSPDLKAAGNRLAVVGLTRDDLAGSQLELTGRVQGGRVPEVDVASCRAVIHAIAAAQRAGYVQACHDVSDGGLAAAVAEMAIGGRLGATLDLAAVPVEFSPAVDPAHRDLAIAFAETPGRFICEVRADDAAVFEQAVAGVPWAWVGAVTAEPDLAIGSAGRLERIAVAQLDAAWRRMSHQEHSGGHG